MKYHFYDGEMTRLLMVEEWNGMNFNMEDEKNMAKKLLRQVKTDEIQVLIQDEKGHVTSRMYIKTEKENESDQHLQGRLAHSDSKHRAIDKERRNHRTNDKNTGERVR